MIGTTGATVLSVINVLFASVLGIAVGGFTCLVLHRPLGLKPALIDAILAAVVVIIVAYVVGAIESASHVWESRVTLILAIGAASVVVRHLMRLSLRSPNYSFSELADDYEIDDLRRQAISRIDPGGPRPC